MKNQKDVMSEKTKKKELVAPTPNNPHNALESVFDPPTNLPIDCFEADERSYIKDRRWAGNRTAEIVQKKYGGYPNVTNEQLSQATKQAWEEAVAVCKALTAAAVTGNPEAKNTAEPELENPEVKKPAEAEVTTPEPTKKQA